MKKLNNYLQIAKDSLNRMPLFEINELVELCGNAPSVDIGEIKLKANLFGSTLMKIISMLAAGALITAIYLMNFATDAQNKDTDSIHTYNFKENTEISKNNNQGEGVSETSNISAPDIDFENTPEIQDFSFTITEEEGDDIFGFENKITPEQESSLMGYPIIVLSKEEAENIGFIYKEDKILFRQQSRLILPEENNYKSKEQFEEKFEESAEEWEDLGYDIRKDSIIYEEVNIDDGHPYARKLEKEDAKKMRFNNINSLLLNLYKVRVEGNRTYVNDYTIASSGSYLLSRYMSNAYKKKISMFEVQKIYKNKLYKKHSHFYIDTNYKASEVFKKFVHIILPIKKGKVSLVLSGWFLLNKELASKLPKRYQMELKHKFQITEQDYYSEDSQRISVYIDEDSNLPWTKISFVPNHFPLYGTGYNGEYRKLRFEELDKIISYLSAKLPKHLLKEISQSSRNTINILNDNYNSSNEAKLLITMLKADKIKASSINSLELDDKELSKLGVDKTKNRIYFTTESIFNDNKLKTTEYRYRFSHDEIDYDDNEQFLSRGIMSSEYYHFAAHVMDTSKKIHNYNPVLPMAYSLKGQYTFFNSPCTYFSKDKSIKDIFKQYHFTVEFSQRIDSDIKYPFYLHNGTEFEKIGNGDDLGMSYLKMLDRLIPIKIETGFKEIPGPLYLWYLPTTEFLNALPKRYSKSLRKELAILDKIENQNIPVEEACAGFDEESFLGICDLSSGALSNIKIAPNPCLFQLNLSFTASEKRSVSMEVFDINGRSIQILGSFEINNLGEQQHTFDVSSLKTGIYQLVIVSDKGEKISKRFIKQ